MPPNMKVERARMSLKKDISIADVKLLVALLSWYTSKYMIRPSDPEHPRNSWCIGC